MNLRESCQTLIPGYDPWRDAEGFVFDEERAQQAVHFFRDMLTYPDGDLAGEPFLLQGWQQAIVGNLHGWWNERTGKRRYKEAFVLVPRKNGKSAMSAGLMLLEMFMSPTRGGQYFSAAADREQAALIFNDARTMVLENEELSDITSIVPSQKVIKRVDEMGGMYKALSSDAGTKHGTRPCFAIIDELHAHRNGDLVEALLTGTAVKGLQPLFVYITTADYIRESICNSKYKYGCAVRDGLARDAHFLPVIYEAKPEDDWTDPDVWKRANPNYGISVDEDYLFRECEKAKVDAALEIGFKRLHLCMQTAHANRLIQLPLWNACYHEFIERDLLGSPCYGGLDLATEKDLASFVLYFPEGNYVLPFFWLPEENAELRQSRDGIPYRTWMDQRHIIPTSGNFISHQAIGDKILELAHVYDIQAIAFDRAQAPGLYERVSNEGIEMFKHGQMHSHMTGPTKKLLSLIGNGQLQQNGHPVLTWNVQNVVGVVDPYERVRPDKAKSLEKIDGVVAMIMAIGMYESRELKEESVYQREHRGFVEIG